MMNWFGLVKFVTGVLLAIALLFGAGVATARYVITRLTTPPPKPVFAEEQAQPEAEAVATEEVQPEPAPQPAPELPPEAAEEALDPNAYRARVVQPIGMVLRQGPSLETTRVGGIDYNEEIIVLGESSDGAWQNVRLPGSGVEGWIKSGNIEQIE